jgi:hypothetical protein
VVFSKTFFSLARNASFTTDDVATTDGAAVVTFGVEGGEGLGSDDCFFCPEDLVVLDLFLIVPLVSNKR